MGHVPAQPVRVPVYDAAAAVKVLPLQGQGNRIWNWDGKIDSSIGQIGVENAQVDLGKTRPRARPPPPNTHMRLPCLQGED